jgi:hypothetical protein
MRHLCTFLLMISMGLLSWGAAQSARPDLFDLKKSQQELEVMKGILSTTLNFVLKELRDSSTGKAERDEVQVYKDFTVHGPWGGSRVSAFYLYGQGATFIIPVSALRYAKAKPVKAVGEIDVDQLKLDGEIEALRELQLQEQLDEQVVQLDVQLADLEAQEQELSAHQFEMILGLLDGVPGGVPGGIVGGVPGGVGGGIPVGVRGPAKVLADLNRQMAELTSALTPDHPKVKRLQAQIDEMRAGQRPKPAKPVAQVAPPQPPQAPQPGAAPRSPQKEEEVRKRVEDLQRSLVKRREEAELKRKQLLERLAQVKIYLIEALANHGDSLTHVKPNEFINLVLTAEEGGAKVFNLADSEGESSHREIMSVQKSVITEYKAGRLTLDAFKQKVLQYNN